MIDGGRIIEIKEHTLLDLDKPNARQKVLRLWVLGQYDEEVIVYADLADELPELGELVWWQGGDIYFSDGHKQITKIGYSHEPFYEPLL